MAPPLRSRTPRAPAGRSSQTDRPSRAADLEAIKAHTRVTFFRSGGPGGQHRNKTQTAVRLVHEPTGLTVVAADERSQHRNLTVAFDRLRRKLIARSAVPRPRVPTRTPTAVRRARLETKHRQAKKKVLRRRVEDA
jgi:protein subunit release factor B